MKGEVKAHLQMMFVDVLESCLGLGPEVVSALLHVQSNRWKTRIFCGTHEQESVASPSPRGLDVFGLLFVVLGVGHDPTEDSDLLGQLLGLRIFAWKEER